MTRPSSLADLASIYDSQPISGMRNRIINGDMRIDQRNAGASVTPASDVYHLDRWTIFAAPYGAFTVQQNAGSVTPPPGFTNYFGITSTSTTAASTGNYGQIVQHIEGFNTADFNWGTANAQTVTLSFWVRSSLTGTFGGSLRNSADNRAYLFSYTINAANTWEQKIITIPGDTTGTWLTNNGRGISLRFAFMMGSTVIGAPGSWTTGGTFAPTGQTNVLGTNGATFYLTGVQLEAGPFATPFERRQYGHEFDLCQRYFQRNARVNGIWVTGSIMRFVFQFPVVMRTGVGEAGVTLLNASGYHEWWNQAGYTGISSLILQSGDPASADIQVTSSSNRGRSFNDPALIAQNIIGISAEL